MSESTASMWLKMLGLDGLWQTAQSPDFQAQMQALVAAILETRIRCERIEFKLDAMLDKLGMNDIARRPPVALVPSFGTAAGPGSVAAASASADAGTGAGPRPYAGDGERSGRIGSDVAHAVSGPLGFPE